MEDTVDKVHFAQFVKLLYLNSIDRAGLKAEDKTSYKKMVIIDFVQSLYPTRGELNFMLDSETIEHVQNVLNFCASDQRYNELIPFHTFVNRMRNEIPAASYQFILARYRSMTNFYYRIYTNPEVFRPGEGMVPPGVRPFNQMVRGLDRQDSAPGNDHTLRSESALTHTVNDDDGDSHNIPTQPTTSTAPTTKTTGRRGRPRKTDTIPVATGTDEILDEDVVEEDTTSVPNTVAVKPAAKRRGRPPKAKA